VDAVVAEGFEAGGHNGIDETTTLCLIPAVKAVMDIPVSIINI
jgi:enoyl-[acyl-carrier protein] reductase II